jgi:cyclopropane-fatty-acyl-phospholipid synthase
MSTNISVKKLADQLDARQTRTAGSRMNGIFKKAMLKHLEHLEYGNLSIEDGDEVYQFIGGSNKQLTAHIKVLDDQFYWYLVFGGSVGAGEAYINNYWQSHDLTRVIQLFAINQSMMDSMEGGLAKLTTPIKQGFHWLNKNTRKGSRSNIVAHYDLGNEFFKVFLDPSMMYSSGIFLQPDDSMHQASLNKLERICERLRLTATDHLVEIGTGWGSFAIYAAKNYGCKVTTTTISDEQYDYAEQRIKEENLQDQITLLKEDYRNLEGQFDKLVSIEMIEAVGHQYFDTFFKKCSDLLKPEGEMLLQAITISDQRFDSAKKDVDFIKRYIFPGSCIPSVDAISKSIRSSSDMRVLNLEDIGVHYALTLNKWRETFFNKIDQVKEQGYSDAFIRMWEFYLCYCEGGFKERVISVVQMHQVKPLARVPMTLTKLEK